MHVVCGGGSLGLAVGHGADHGRKRPAGLPTYSLCLAHTNDTLSARQMVAASSSLVLVNGLGAVLGPVAVAGLMRAVGPDGFFWFLAAVYLGMGVLAFRHMAARESPAPARQGGAGPVPLAAVFAVEQGAAPAGGGASGIGPAGPAPLPESASAAVRP